MPAETIRPLPPLLEKIAKTELNEDPKRIQSDLDALKTWLDKQQHLISRRDDQFLISFLRGCKYSLERAKEKIDMFYTLKTASPEMFGLRDPLDPHLQELLKLGIIILLPKPHESNGARIIVSRPCLNDPQKYNMVDVIKTAYMGYDYCITEDDHAVIGGVIQLIDLKGISMAHTAQLSVGFLKKISLATQEANPYRMKAIHFINPAKSFEIIFKIFYQFLNDKLKKRVFIHSSLEKLHEELPKHLLPKEYGGELDSIEVLNNNFIKKIVSKRDYFLEDIKYKTDESKRIKPLKNSEFLFGMDGSFRKLEID